MSKYTDAMNELIDRSKADPLAIWNAWISRFQPGSLLFGEVAPKGYVLTLKDPCMIGLDQINRGHGWGYTDTITQQIRADKRLNKHPLQIATDDLPVWVEWNERLDEYWAAELARMGTSTNPNEAHTVADWITPFQYRRLMNYAKDANLEAMASAPVANLSKTVAAELFERLKAGARA